VGTDVILRQLMSGLSGGAILFIIAGGLAIIFGTLNIINLAHGSLYMLAGFLCFQITSWLSSVSGNYWISLLIAPLVVALVGGIIEVFLIRRIYNVHMLFQLVLTFALIFVIQDVVRFIWGTRLYSVSTPWPFGTRVAILGLKFPIYQFFLIVVAILVFFGISALMHYTKLGRTVRAVTANRDMANALGINVPMIYTVVFMLGCWLAGLAGTLLPPMSVVALGKDMDVLINCFIVVVIGGLGSLPGAFIGAMILGVVTSFGIAVLPRMAIAFGFILMAIVLIFRPYGLMGRPD